MSSFSTPGIYINEIDNSIRANTVTGNGIGAIVLKSNKGPVNQRILTNSYSQFTTVFGEPENLDDYGHFAAENFLGVSNQLLCVRATMGDEGYAQIQYPYTDAATSAKNTAKDVASFKFIDNQGDSNLTLLQKLEPVVTIESVKRDNWEDNDEYNGFALYQKGKRAVISDLITDNPSAVAIFAAGDGDKTGIVGSGKYVSFATNIKADNKVTKWNDDVIINSTAWNDTLSASVFDFDSYKSSIVVSGDVSGQKVQFTLNKNQTLNGEDIAIKAFLNTDAISAIKENDGIAISDLFSSETFYGGSAFINEPEDAVKVEFLDWDDCTKKTYYVSQEEYEDTLCDVGGITYREYGYNDFAEDLVAIADEYAPTVSAMDKIDFETANMLADQYGVDAIDIISSKYALITYRNPSYIDDSEDSLIMRVVYVNEKTFVNPQATNLELKINDRLFFMTVEKNADKATVKSVYTADKPEVVVIPWGITDNIGVDDDNKVVKINKMTAYPTTEVLNSTNENYKDGYTISMDSDDEPGNGDIEQYNSNMDNQLIIAAIGPGAYGNDIGVSIITTECADIPALNHQNAFNWKYHYDDEDQIDADVEDLTWKKVYRINVYVKPKTQTADAAWGFGMDALLKDPIEFFYVSNDPTAKDAEGNSLYAPNVINGRSNYIYVSRSSVNDARTGAGTYAQPVQTYAIYGLTGGTNSKKNNMSEKTAALKLYSDRQKANLDILFNVDAIDSFNTKQRYNAHQRRIAEIASTRGKDIGVVQVTSKSAKSVKLMLSEAKMFSFNNGSYVAEYANYDKYYNSTLASWIYLPKSIAAACAMAYCDNYAYPWMAPAGVARGTIGYSTAQLTRVNDDEIGQLYDINVNSSRECGGFGEVIWGHKTALKKESALNRINVRRCLNYIEKQLEVMLVPYLFQQNTPNTRSAARNSIDAFLSRVQSAEGLESYSLKVYQDPQDPHTMNVEIKVWPAEALEYIRITVTIERNSGIMVTEG